jgi:two-component system sensor histidine kinase DegS
MEAAMYRLAQEAFNNAYKHAQPTYVSLELNFLEDSIQLLISDNGIGFSVEQVDSKARVHSQFGLVGMRERVELLQGKINIESSVGEGTKIKIQVPLGVEPGKELGEHGK